MLTSRKKNPNMSRKSESVSFSLYGSQGDLGFHLYLDFWCKPTAATMDMMHWETGHVKCIISCIIKVNFPFACRSVAIERESKVCQGKYVIWHTCPADELEKKNQYGSLGFVCSPLVLRFSRSSKQ